MAEGAKGAAEDPSMEDILASIRSILNDESPPAQPATPQAEQHSRPAGAADDVFVLDQSMLIEEPAKMVPDVSSQRSAVPPPQAPVAPEPAATEVRPAAHVHENEPLLAPAAAAAASASMGALVRVVSQQQTPVYHGGPTLEDMVREELRPLVKSWLDEHLAPMVEHMVRAEIARVTNGK